LHSMERNDNIKDSQVTKSFEETVALDLSLAAGLNFPKEDTKCGDGANNESTGKGDDIANTAADKDGCLSMNPTFSHFQKSSNEMGGMRNPNPDDRKILEGDENDSSVSSISSGECEHAHHPALTTADGDHNLTYDESALATKREYNRQNAARARKRAKTQLQNLQEHVQALNMSIGRLKDRNLTLQQTVQTLREQNALLTQNQGSIEGNNAASTTRTVNSTSFPANTTTIDSSVQTTLLQLLLATAASPSPDSMTQQSQPALSIQQQTLYYWLLSQMLQQYQQPQSPNVVQPPLSQPPTSVQPIQLDSTSSINASNQLMALLLSQVQSGAASSNPQHDSNEAKSHSLFYPTSRDAEPPPK
jgi:hypothetical protein